MYDVSPAASGFTDLPADALVACAAEPIHLPAAVQPHGLLLAIGPDGPGGPVEQVSENCERWLGCGPEAALGRTVRELLGPAAAAVLQRHAGAGRLVDPLAVTLPTARGDLPALLHHSEDSLIIEIADAEAAESGAGAFTRLHAEAVARTTLADLGAVVARAVRAETGYARVLIYRFLPDGNGEVFAEDVDPRLPSYLGLRYPSSDIPPQARALYLRQRVRVLGDTEAPPAALVPPRNPRTGRPLDQSRSALRAMSPVHLQYLRNMRARATLVASIVLDGALFGLIACHHDGPRVPSEGQCRFAESAASLLATQVGALRDRAVTRARQAADALGRQVIRAVDGSQSWWLALLRHAPATLALLRSDGMLLLDPVVDTRGAREGGADPAPAGAPHAFTGFGEVPPAETLCEVIAWLNHEARQPIVVEDNLGARFPALASHARGCSGLLALRLSERPPLFALFFRRERAVPLRWAGNPHKGLTADPEGRPRLTPRTSFSLFLQESRGHAEPLGEPELAAAAQLRTHLASAVLGSTLERLRATERDRDRIIRALDGATIPKVISDESGEVLLVNAAFERRFALDRIALQAGGLALLASLPVQEHPGLRRALNAGAPFRADLLLRQANGALVWHEVQVEPLSDGPAQALGFLVRFVDISDRKLRELALEQARQSAESADRAKSVFLANMSHEVRTPLTAILGHAQLLREGGEEPAATAEHTEVILRNGRYLLAILNDILDLSKISAGQMKIELTPVTTAQFFSDLLALLQPQAQGKGLALILEAETALPRVLRTDLVRVRQILLNLLGNAIKFTEAGEVRLVVAHEAGVLRCLVVDQGIGLTPDEQARLFQPFAQADATVARRYGGTGLGLAISRQLARLLSGDLELRSTPGQGTTAELRVAAEAEGEARWQPQEFARIVSASLPPRSVEPRPAAPPPRLTGTVLLADDGRDNQVLIGALLRKLGAQVVTVGDGRSAVDSALGAAEPFRLVLMDMMMPELDGYDAVAELRQRGYGGPIVALTASAMAGDRARCLAAGCDDYLTKPLDLTEFRAVCVRYLPAAEA